ncbi:MAG: HAD family hydrolase [Thermoplasmatota archaeon]
MDVHALAFDLDGTITCTDVRFAPYRERIGCGDRDVLAFIEEAHPEDQAVYYRILDDYERAIRERCRLNDGFREVMQLCRRRGIKTGIITRSSRRHAREVVRQLDIPIATIIGREDAPPKPSGRPLLLLAELLQVEPADMLFVGDFLWDLMAGRNAGVTTVLLLNQHNREYASLADHSVRSLHQLVDLLA